MTDKKTEESEQLVYEQSSKTISETDNLVCADFNFKDLDRLMTFFNIPKETGRKFVVKINDAFFLKYLSQDKHLKVPNIDEAVSEINAKTLFPVHTEHSEIFKKVSDNRILIDEGVKYKI